MEPEQLLDLMSPAHREVLLALREEGEAWVADLAATLEVSVGALRQSLRKLEARGLVIGRPVSSARGRPRTYYRLAPAAENLFAQRQGIIVQMLSAALDLVSTDRPVTFASWGEQGARQNPPVTRGPAPLAAARTGTLDALESAFRHAGYYPELIVSSEAADFVLHNCPVLDVAQGRPALCELERRYIESLSDGAEAVRKAHRLDGAPLCTYRLIRQASTEEASSDG